MLDWDYMHLVFKIMIKDTLLDAYKSKFLHLNELYLLLLKSLYLFYSDFLKYLFINATSF